MFHLRTPDSTHRNPVTWCGAEPEVSVLGYVAEGVDETGSFWQVTQPRLTEWEWVKNTAHYASLCQVCVACRQAVKSPQEYVQSEGVAECPF